MTLAAFVLHVSDHEDHDIGRFSHSLDRKVRVSWAASAVRQSPMVKNGTVKMLRLDVQAGTINGTTHSHYAQLLSKSSMSADRLLPLMAQCWSSAAPVTARGNLSKKLGQLERMKDDLVERSAKLNEDGKMDSVEQWISTPMVNIAGSRRAVWAMLVAATFAADLSQQEGVPVVVLGRPPSHHATCYHCIGLDAPHVQSPGGLLSGHNLEGGCFYPSCWVAAVHALREGSASRLAYIDVDAHKPDGIWKEMERLRGLGKEQRTMLLGQANRCEEVLFASVHIDDYPNPEERHPRDPPDPRFKWNSVDRVLAKETGKAFAVSVLEELLPKGIGLDEDGEDGPTTNKEVIACFDHWQKGLLRKLTRFKPNGIFVGLGFDLHALEKQIEASKRPGIGIEAKHYRALLAALPTSGLQNGPIVLTMEGGYTKDAVMDGMRGVLDGLVQLAHVRGKERRPSTIAVNGGCKRKLSSDALTKPTKKKRTSCIVKD